MSDRPKKQDDRGFENHNAEVGTPVALGAVSDPESRAVLKAEDSRKSRELGTLTDEFGKTVFPAPIVPESGEAGPRSHHGPHVAHDCETSVGGIDTLAAGHPDQSEFQSKDGKAWQPAKLLAAGAGKGSTDIGAVSALPDVGSAGTVSGAAALMGMLSDASSVGLTRADRIEHRLVERHADNGVEHFVSMMINSTLSQKKTELKQQSTVLTEKEEKEKSNGNKDPRFKKELGESLTAEEMALIKTLFDKGEKADKVDPDKTVKDFTNWTDARSAAGSLSNAQQAERGMADLVKMAQGGNPFARELLAATLVSGDRQGQDAWTAAKRSESGNNRSINIPGLAPEMSDKLKVQAAKALISMGDGPGGLSRSEQMALAVCFGQALDNKVNGKSSKQNDDLLTCTADHFLKAFSSDRNPANAGSEAERKQLSTSMQNVMGGMFDAIRGDVRGASLMAQFLGQIAGAETSSIKAMHDTSSDSDVKSQGSIKTTPEDLTARPEKGLKPEPPTESSVKKAPSDASVKTDTSSKSNSEVIFVREPEVVGKDRTPTNPNSQAQKQTDEIFVKEPAAASRKNGGDSGGNSSTLSPEIFVKAPEMAVTEGAEAVAKAAQQVSLQTTAEASGRDKPESTTKESAETTENSATELPGQGPLPSRSVMPQSQSDLPADMPEDKFGPPQLAIHLDLSVAGAPGNDVHSVSLVAPEDGKSEHPSANLESTNRGGEPELRSSNVSDAPISGVPVGPAVGRDRKDEPIASSEPGPRVGTEQTSQRLQKEQLAASEQQSESQSVQQHEAASVAATESSEMAERPELGAKEKAAVRNLLSRISKVLPEVWSNPDSLREAYQSSGDKLYKTAKKASIEFEHRPEIISAADILDGNITDHNSKLQGDGSKWDLKQQRSIIKIAECQTLIELDSGRLYDPMTNRFFRKFGDDTALADGKPATEQDRNQIADLMKSEHMKAIMRNHLLARMNESLYAMHFANNKGNPVGPAVASTTTAPSPEPANQ